MTILALLLSAAVFGGMILFSFGFAPFVFRYLEADAARKMIRFAFPWYYWFVIAGGAAAAASLIFVNTISAQMMLIVVLLGMIAVFILMPRINTARDGGEAQAKMFRTLHRTSVILNMVQIALIAWVLARFIEAQETFQVSNAAFLLW